nr:hypothetical protein WMHIBSEC_WMHIBSEC_CDS_0002 [Caudoviricetes sp.]CAI9751640.1 hypothetical protein AZFZUZMX_AZFZUZMX_CDS_0002 [Caudoviricetes sp.]
MTKILTESGIKKLWTKIKEGFLSLNGGTVRGELVASGGIKTKRLIGGIDNSETGNADARLFIGGRNYYEFDFDVKDLLYDCAGITINESDTTSQNYNVSILGGSQVGILSQQVRIRGKQNIMLYGAEAMYFTNYTYESETREMCGMYGVRISSSALTISSPWAKFAIPYGKSVGTLSEDGSAWKPYFITTNAFAMDYTEDGIDGDANDNDSPTSQTSKCKLFFDKDHTYIGHTDKSTGKKLRNNIEFGKDVVRVRVHDESLLKVSQDAAWKKNATKNGNVAVFNNFYVVNPATNKAGLKIETNVEGDMITTIGDKSINSSDCVQIQYAGHTYSLDLVKLENDGYLNQID